MKLWELIAVWAWLIVCGTGLVACAAILIWDSYQAHRIEQQRGEDENHNTTQRRRDARSSRR